MIVNFKTREISLGTHKLARTSTLIKKKKQNYPCEEGKKILTQIEAPHTIEEIIPIFIILS